MRETVSIQIAGERVDLFPERAAWWVRRRTLLVSDLHLGKEQAFATLGVGVPSGVLDETLERLGRCITDVGAERVLILGDILHARQGLTPVVVDRVAAWRDSLDTEIGVVPGNHDRDLETVAPRWRMTLREVGLLDGPFRFVHEPDQGVEGSFTWAGHLHPAVALSAGRDTIRLPCFRVGSRVGVLPAFSPFTGRTGVPVGPDDTLFAVAPDRVFQVPARVPTSR